MPPEDQGGPTDNIDMIAASLRADSSDLDTYTNVLLNTLGGAFPEHMVDVTHDRTLVDKVAGRPGKVASVRINFDNTSLQLQQSRTGRPEAIEVTTVGGVTISRKELSLADWSRRLAAELVVAADRSQEAATALNRLLGL